MLIDWFTVVAQALNFAILVWLMKRFLYQPILRAIDDREKRVAAELADADSKKAEAQKGTDEFNRKNADFDRDRAAILAKATEGAQAERKRLLDQAGKDADALGDQRKAALREEEKSLLQEIRRRTSLEVVAIARKVLADLAGTGLEERVGEVFIRRLRQMDDRAQGTLRAALQSGSDPAILRSSFDLTEAQRAAIQKALNETFSAEIKVRFETAPDLVAGVELTAKGQKVSWNVADYLGSLEKGVEDLLKEKATPSPTPPPKPKPDPIPEPKPAVKAEPPPVALKLEAWKP